MLLIDGDEQQTAMAFTQLRSDLLGEAGYTAVALQEAAIRTQGRQLAPKVGHLIIDVGGRDTRQPAGRPDNRRRAAHPHAAAQL